MAYKKFSELKDGDGFVSNPGGMVYFKLCHKIFFNILEIHIVKDADFQVLPTDWNCITNGGMTKEDMHEVAMETKTKMPSGKMPKFPVIKMR